MFSSVKSSPFAIRYSLRHGRQPLKRDMEEPGLPHASLPVPGDDGRYPFPILDGGTFSDIVHRAQCSEWLVEESTKLLFAAKFIEADDQELFKEAYVTAADAWLRCRFKLCIGWKLS